LKEFDGDAYIADRINNALATSRTRTTSYPKPQWWDDNKNGLWLDCISTATSNYGDENVVTGNKTFARDYDKFGFRRLEDGEPLQAGDIIQYQDPVITYGAEGEIINTYYSPTHATLLDSIGEGGELISNYSDGSGHYRKHKEYPYGGIIPNLYYRFIGTPAERAEIAEHNARVKEQQKQIYGNEKGKPTSLPSKVEPFPIAEKEAKISKEQLARTLDFLDHIKKR